QHRERIFIVAKRRSLNLSFKFSVIRDKHPKLRDILDPHPDPKYTLTPHLCEYLQSYEAKHKAAGQGIRVRNSRPRRHYPQAVRKILQRRL
ncbi:MAG: hypothetical protein K5657_00205, partial [Desulfovibrio sp.]|nr:hypothetical protein [Desulfovibrio sp.]